MSRKEKLEDLKKDISGIGDQIKDSAETAQIKGMYKKDEIVEKVKESKGNVEAAKENVRRVHERGKSKFSSELLKMQMNMEETKNKFAEKKETKNKEKLEKYIDDQIEYAEDCVATSILAAREAKLAFLEALDAEMEYEEKYGEEDEDKQEQ
jgi:hypothetical protein